MLLLNYAHPLTADQLAQIAVLVGIMPTVRPLTAQIERAVPLAEAARSLADAAGLSAEEWQITPLLINPPGLAPLALALLAEIHGRGGYFPALINVRPVVGALPPRFEVAEIVNLQALREAARAGRDP